MKRALIADDHPVVLAGVEALLTQGSYAVVARCASGEDVLRAVIAEDPDLLVLDLNMPPPSGLELLNLPAMRDYVPRTVLLTSELSPNELNTALQAGIGGLVLKESAAQLLLQCLNAVSGGVQWVDPQVTKQLLRQSCTSQAKVEKRRPAATVFTPREREVVELAAQGSRNKEIGRALGLTEGTVKAYLHSASRKLQASNRMELVNAARQGRMLEDP
ncbi:response regulator [Limimaricola soesokkakensis]|uniref:response regulator n=1 Tax=Limimaricola soesokkakensis TaxID=1343159 RepID=UPI003514898E